MRGLGTRAPPPPVLVARVPRIGHQAASIYWILKGNTAGRANRINAIGAGRLRAWGLGARSGLRAREIRRAGGLGAAREI